MTLLQNLHQTTQIIKTHGIIFVKLISCVSYILNYVAPVNILRCTSMWGSLIQLDLNNFSSICINFNFVFHTFSGNNIYLVNELTAFSLQFSFNDLTWHLLTGDLDGVLNRYLSLHVLWVHIHRRHMWMTLRTVLVVWIPMVLLILL